MLDPGYRDTLLSKAIEGEPMSDLELRDFGEAVLQEPEVAEDYLFARRLAAHAPEMSATGLSPDFADGVMAALDEIKPPQSEISASPGWSWSAVAAVLVFAAAGMAYWTPNWEIGEMWSRFAQSTWFEWTDAIGQGAAALFSSEWVFVKIPFLAGVIFWLALGLPLLAGTLNYWSVKRLK